MGNFNGRQEQPEDAGASVAAWGLGSQEEPQPRGSRCAHGCASSATVLSRAQALGTRWDNATWTCFLPQRSEQMLPQRESQGSI